MLEQEWVRELFTRFCRERVVPLAIPRLPARVDRYSIVFSLIDRSFDSPRKVNVRSLFEAFGAEGLRRGFEPVSFVIGELGIAWDPQQLVDLTEGRRLSELMKQCSSEPWFEILASFRAFLQTQSKIALSRRTERLYVAEASRLLKHLQPAAKTDIDRKALDRYVSKHRGAAASLSVFAGFLGEMHPTLSRRGIEQIRRHDRELIKRSRRLFAYIKDNTNPRRGRAVTAALISAFLGVRLKTILATRWSGVKVTDESVKIGEGNQVILLLEPLRTIFLQQCRADGEGPWVFAGRNRHQMLSADAVRYHVRSVMETVAANRS